MLKYRSLRITDSEPILFIKNQLNGKSIKNIADVGCGDGRYSLELLKNLGNECFIHCVDSNENMLKSLVEYFNQNRMDGYCIRQGKHQDCHWRLNLLIALQHLMQFITLIF